MTSLSVNINKVATLRNARGGNVPDVIQFAKDCERFGADGITVHPRPDQRHITLQDVHELASVIKTEFNIEGYPDDRYLQIIREIRPAQATLVPDPPDVLTSNNGWDAIHNSQKLKQITAAIQSLGVRVSVFLNPDVKQVVAAHACGVNRVEFYTGPYAEQYRANKHDAVAPYVIAVKEAVERGIGINAGHDLSLENLRFFKHALTRLDEVSIGHALISDALYFGIENTIQMYKRQLL